MVPKDEISVSTRIFTKKSTKGFSRQPLNMQKYGYKSVTACEKPNVIRETSGMMY